MDNNRRKRGRPPVDISWPDVEFTAQDVVETLPSKVSRVTVHSKLNKAVDVGDIKVTGTEKSTNGRPRVKYLKVTKEKLGIEVPKEIKQDLQQSTDRGPTGFIG